LLSEITSKIFISLNRFKVLVMKVQNNIFIQTAKNHTTDNEECQVYKNILKLTKSKANKIKNHSLHH